jgi:hypothetical protein
MRGKAVVAAAAVLLSAVLAVPAALAAVCASGDRPAMTCCEAGADGCPSEPSPCCRLTPPVRTAPGLVTARTPAPALVLATPPPPDAVVASAPVAAASPTIPRARSAPLFLATSALRI